MLRNYFEFFKYHIFCLFYTSYRTKYIVIVPFYAELTFLEMLWLTNCLAQLEPSEYFAGYHISHCTSAQFEKQDRSSTETKGNINQIEVWIICSFRKPCDFNNIPFSCSWVNRSFAQCSIRSLLRRRNFSLMDTEGENYTQFIFKSRQ